MKRNARHELFYVTDQDPQAGPTNPTNYKKVGNVTSASQTISRNLIPSHDKDSGEASDHQYGRISGQIPVEGNRDFAGDDGQKLVRDAALNATELWFLRTTNMVGDQGWYGRIKVANYDEGSDDEAIGTYSFTGEIQGAPVAFTVTT